MDLRRIYATVGRIYLGLLLVFASSKSHEKPDIISPSDDQLLVIKSESTTASFFVNAASNSAYLAENEVDISGDSMPTTKQQGHDTDPSTVFSTIPQSQSVNSLHLTSTRQDGTSKFSSPKQSDHNFIPAVNSSTKQQNINKELLSIKQRTENAYLATSLSGNPTFHKNISSANISAKQHSHDADISDTVMKGHPDHNSNLPIQKPTKQQQTSDSDVDANSGAGAGAGADPLAQLSTKQHTFNDDPSTLESAKEIDTAALKVNSESDPVTTLDTKSNDDALNEFTAKPSQTFSHNFHTTKSATTNKKLQSNIPTFSSRVPGPVQNFTIKNIHSTTVLILLRPPKEKGTDILGYIIKTHNDKFCRTRIINCTGCKDLTKNQNFEIPGSCRLKLCNYSSMEKVDTLSKDILIKDLSAYHNYEITVMAYNKEGCGNETHKHFTTLESIPSPVQHLEITKVTNTSLEFQWELPRFPNGNITVYEVEYTMDNVRMEHNKTKKRAGVLEKLHPYKMYTIDVRACTRIGCSNSSSVKNRTLIGIPTPVQHLEIAKVTNTSLEFRWERPRFPNADITKYRVEYKRDNVPMDSYITEKRAGVLEKLHPYKMYTIYVYACTRIGCSNSSSVKNKTLVGIPMNVNNVRAYPNSSTEVIVKWDRPEDEMGPTNYTVETWDNGKRLQGCQAEGFKSSKCTVSGLEKYWCYSFKVIAYTSAGHSVAMESETVRTLESTPGCVTDLDVGYKSYTKMYVKWKSPKPHEQNGIIRKYVVSLLEQNGPNQSIIVNETYRYQELTVKPEHNFTIQVQASTNAGKGCIEDRKISVPAGPPAIPEGILFRPAPFLVKERSKQIAIQLPMKFFSSNSNGTPVIWGLIVAQSEAVTGNSTVAQMDRNDFNLTSMRRWHQVHDSGIIRPYRPTADDWKPLSFDSDYGNRHYILGEDKNCGTEEYCNGYLQPGRSYRIRAFMCTRGGCSMTRYSGHFKTEKDMSPVYISTPILLTLAILSVAAIFLMWRKQLFCFRKHPIAVLTEVSSIHRTGETNKSFIMNLEPRSRIIMLDEFHDKLERMKKDSNLLFCEEFQLLRSCSPSKSHSAAELQANRSKNRYTNIMAYDHSRVKLLPLDDEEGSDYINANYMPGYQSKREYIAAQGPLPGTKDDFWRMIWEQNVSVVVMVTQAVERGRIKCEIYWPTGTDPVYFGDLVVQLRSESNLSDYILRILDVQLGEQKREVKHFHFLKWPDFGCPANTSLLINFIQTVRSYMPYTVTGPTIIHCSAGVGRTGTFIAIDWLLQHIREHQEIDIFGLILEMRNYRINMVQTEDQYIFIHQCIADHLLQLEGSVEEDVFINDTQM